MPTADQWPTRRQIEVLDAIRDHIADCGIAPTIRELCEMVGTSSVGSMSKHLESLERSKLIKRGGSRKIEITGNCPYCKRSLSEQDQSGDADVHGSG